MFKFKSLLLLFIFTIFCSVNAMNDVVYIFAHGLGGDVDQITPYKQYGIILNNEQLKVTSVSVEGPEVLGGRSKIALAQEADIAVLEQQIINQCTQKPDCKIILVGVSKGAATIINTVGKLSLENSQYLKNITATVIESSPADFNDVAFEKFCPCSIEWTLGKNTSQSIFNAITHKFVFPSYDPNGIQPIKSINERWLKVPKDMVIVLIHSKKDQLININHSQRIYSALYTQGFNNLYFIQAEEGGHANVFWGQSYQNVLQNLWSIYLKHGLPAPEYLHNNEGKELVHCLTTYNEIDAQCATLQPKLFDAQNNFRQMGSTEKICLAGIGIISAAIIAGGCTIYKKCQNKKRKKDEKKEVVGTAENLNSTTPTTTASN